MRDTADYIWRLLLLGRLFNALLGNNEFFPDPIPFVLDLMYLLLVLITLELLLQLFEPLLQPLIFHSESLHLLSQLSHLGVPLTNDPLTPLFYPHYLRVNLFDDMFKSPLLFYRPLSLNLSLPQLGRDHSNLMHQVSFITLARPQPCVFKLKHLHFLMQRLQSLAD